MNTFLTYCVDANLVIRLVANPKDVTIQSLWKEWDATQVHLVAPTLLFYEVTNALYQYQKASIMSAIAAQKSLRAALALSIHLYSEPLLHKQALDFATRFSLKATYDSHYLALAEHLGVDFWTADRRLVRAVQSKLDWVHLVES